MHLSSVWRWIRSGLYADESGELGDGGGGAPERAMRMAGCWWQSNLFLNESRMPSCDFQDGAEWVQSSGPLIRCRDFPIAFHGQRFPFHEIFVDARPTGPGQTLGDIGGHFFASPKVCISEISYVEESPSI